VPDSTFLELQNVVKSFDGTPVLRDISLQVESGQVVALLGPSGSGKTTLLRVIAGLESVDSGQVRLEGQDLTQIAVHERGFGMVFQEYALFPHKNVAENVAFGLRMLGWPRAQIEERVQQMLGLVGLEGFGNRAVYDLSGGEQQRVALARALAPSPRLLLLDEPLGALDRALRERLMGELRAILSEADALSDRPESMTAIYVTHDQAEAFAVSDRVIVLEGGCIVQDDPPVELYRHPRTPFVARFIGMENLYDATLLSNEPPVVASELGELQLSELPAGLDAESEAVLLVRPEAGHLVGADGAEQNVVHGKLEAVSFRGRYQQATISAGREGVQLKLEFEPTDALPPPGSELAVALVPEALVLLQQDGAMASDCIG
jgi:ABC-type Fe3+/spermidine/putrescine transport system ATPase subunit